MAKGSSLNRWKIYKKKPWNNRKKKEHYKQKYGYILSLSCWAFAIKFGGCSKKYITDVVLNVDVK